mmetsp:Transcript_38471/g.60976  ORF Transcript_38471/g.60976 Transcript_38471/m.60976 type:complete len:788 (-) Transcript_38471:222-2585(-)
MHFDHVLPLRGEADIFLDPPTDHQKRSLLTCLSIRRTAQSLDLSRSTTSSSLTLFHRLTERTGVVDETEEAISAITCLFLGGKMEDSPKKLADIIVSYAQHCHTPLPSLFPSLSVSSILPSVTNLSLTTPNSPVLNPHHQEVSLQLQAIKTRVFSQERTVLEILKFDIAFEHPYQFVQECAEQLGFGEEPEVVERAIMWIHDSFLIPLCAHFSPRSIASACVLTSHQWKQQQTPPSQERSQVTSPSAASVLCPKLPTASSISPRLQLSPPTMPAIRTPSPTTPVAQIQAPTLTVTIPTTPTPTTPKSKTPPTSRLNTHTNPTKSQQQPSPPNRTPRVPRPKSQPLPSPDLLTCISKQLSSLSQFLRANPKLSTMNIFSRPRPQQTAVPQTPSPVQKRRHSFVHQQPSPQLRPQPQPQSQTQPQPPPQQKRRFSDSPNFPLPSQTVAHNNNQLPSFLPPPDPQFQPLQEPPLPSIDTFPSSIPSSTPQRAHSIPSPFQLPPSLPPSSNLFPHNTYPLRSRSHSFHPYLSNPIFPPSEPTPQFPHFSTSLPPLQPSHIQPLAYTQEQQPQQPQQPQPPAPAFDYTSPIIPNRRNRPSLLQPQSQSQPQLRTQSQLQLHPPSQLKLELEPHPQPQPQPQPQLQLQLQPQLQPQPQRQQPPPLTLPQPQLQPQFQDFGHHEERQPFLPLVQPFQSSLHLSSVSPERAPFSARPAEKREPPLHLSQEPHTARELSSHSVRESPSHAAVRRCTIFPFVLHGSPSQGDSGELQVAQPDVFTPPRAKRQRIHDEG